MKAKAGKSKKKKEKGIDKEGQNSVLNLTTPRHATLDRTLSLDNFRPARNRAISTAKRFRTFEPR